MNAISPGHIDTPIFDGWQQGDALTKIKQDLAESVPLGRMGDPDEIAKAVSFLASDEASYVSRIELFVDGAVARFKLRTSDFFTTRKVYKHMNTSAQKKKVLVTGASGL